MGYILHVKKILKRTWRQKRSRRGRVTPWLHADISTYEEPFPRGFKVAVSTLLILLLTVSPVLPSIFPLLLFGALSSSASTAIWDGGGADSSWGTKENWLNDVIPGPDDIATFNATSTKDVVINTDVSVAGIHIEETYPSTIETRSGKRIIVGLEGFQQENGTFITDTLPVDILGDLTVEGGSFVAPSNVLSIKGNMSVFSAGEFVHNNGSVALTGVTQNIFGSITFFNLTKIADIGQTLQLQSGSTITTLGTLRLRGSAAFTSTGGDADSSAEIASLLSNTEGLLNIFASKSGEPAIINPSGSVDLAYLNLKDIINTSPKQILCDPGCVNSGNVNGIETPVSTPPSSPTVATRVRTFLQGLLPGIPTSSPTSVALQSGAGRLEEKETFDFAGNQAALFIIDISSEDAKDSSITPARIVSTTSTPSGSDEVSGEDTPGDGNFLENAFKFLQSGDENTASQSSALPLIQTAHAQDAPAAISALVIDPTGQVREDMPAIITPVGERYAIEILKPQDATFNPGTYTLRATINNTSIEHQFTWGTLLLNLPKSIYEAGQAVGIGIVVLDAAGRTTCDADISLTISSPGKTDITRTTATGAVTRVQTCSPTSITNEPDYVTRFTPETPGIYEITATANKVHTITQVVEVANASPAFATFRHAPTRVNPTSPYKNEVTITAQRDFTGAITEVVPPGFSITDISHNGALTAPPVSAVGGEDPDTVIEQPVIEDIVLEEDATANEPIESETIEATPTPEATPGPEAEEVITPSPEPTVEATPTPTPEPTAIPTPEATDEPEPTVEPSATPEPTQEPTAPEPAEELEETPVAPGEIIQFTQPYILWDDISLAAGQSITLSYTFDAPDEYPQLHLLGPLGIISSSAPTTYAWQEPRAWQVVSNDQPTIETVPATGSPQAALIVRAAPADSPSGFGPGEVVEAYNVKRLLTISAQKIINPRNFPVDIGQLRTPETLLDIYLEQSSQYKFERLDATSVTRTDLTTGEVDTISNEANEDGEYMDVPAYIARQLQSTNHLIFGTLDEEYWYGGNTVLDMDRLAIIWDAIESQTEHRRSDISAAKIARVGSDYIVVPVTDFADNQLVSLTANEGANAEQSTTEGELQETATPSEDDAAPLQLPRRSHRLDVSALVDVPAGQLVNIQTLVDLPNPTETTFESVDENKPSIFNNPSGFIRNIKDSTQEVFEILLPGDKKKSSLKDTLKSLLFALTGTNVAHAAGTVTTSIGSSDRAVDITAVSGSGPYTVTVDDASDLKVGDALWDEHTVPRKYLITAISSNDLTVRDTEAVGAAPDSSGTSAGEVTRYYSTMTLWEADLDDTGIYTSTDDAVGEVYNDAVYDEALTINGGGTVGLASITLTVPEGERHNGTAGTGARNSGNSAQIIIGGEATTEIDSIPRNVHWLEVNGNNRSANGRLVNRGGTSSTVSHMIIHGIESTIDAKSGFHNFGTATSSQTLYFFDSIIYHIHNDFASSSQSTRGFFSASAFHTQVYNLTIHDINSVSTTTGETKGVDTPDDADTTVKNTIVTDIVDGGNTPEGFEEASPASAVFDHNATSDATASGTGSLTNITTANQYISTTLGSEDLHLKNGSDAIDAGTDLVTTPSGVEDDIDGFDRDSNGVSWDIGADESAAIYTWTGSGDGTSWTDPANWDVGRHYPSINGHKVVINTTAAAIATSGAITIGELELSGSFTGTLTLGGNLTIDAAGDQNGNLTISSGTIIQGTSNNLSVGGTTTIGTSGAWYSTGGDVTLGGNVANSGYVHLDGGGLGCGGTDDLVLTGAATWSGSGKYRLYDIDASNQADSSITTYSSTDTTGNTWTFNGTCPTNQAYWIGAGVDENWNTTANWSTGATPTSSTIAIFGPYSTKDADINVNASVASLEVNDGYTGTITQNTSITLTVGTTGYLQYAGTLTGGDAAITINGDTTLAGGAFTSTTGTLAINRVFTHTAGTFSHNNGTVSWTNSSDRAWDVPTTETFYNFTINGSHPAGSGINLSADDTLIVQNTLTLTDGNFNTGTIEAQNGVTHGASFSGGTGLINITGSGTRTITLTAGGQLPAVTLNAPNVTINGNSSGTVIFDKDFTITDGVFTGDAGELQIGNSTSTAQLILNGGTFTAPSGTLTLKFSNFTHTAGTFSHNNGLVAADLSGTRTFDVPTTETFYNFTANGAHPASSDLELSNDTYVIENDFAMTGTIKLNNGAFQVQGDVSVASTVKSGSATLAFTGINDQTYTDAGGDEIDGDITINKTSGTVTLASNADWNAASQDLTLTDGTLVLDGFTLATNALTAASGTILQMNGPETITTTSEDFQSGSTIYITGDEDTTGETLTYTGPDAPHHFTYNATDGNTEILELAVDLTVGGDLTITAGALDVSAAGCTAASCDISVAGAWTNTGIFTAQTGTVTFNGSAATATITPGGTGNDNDFYNLIINGSGSTYTLEDSLDVDSNMTVTEGTIQTDKDETSSVTVAGTLLVEDGGNLIVRRSSTVSEGTGQTITAGTLTVDSGGSINADGEGFTRNTGPGGGPDNQGGTHGGVGSDNADATYGSISNPVSLGSGADNGDGGGAIIISSSGTVTINGELRANAQNITGGDSGAGGSINITSATLAGSGAIQANGDSITSGKGGGGGRISLNGVTTDNFTGTLQANGGSANSRGFAGTIYLNATKRSSWTISSGQTYRLGSDDSNDYTFGTITIENGGTLEIDGNPNLGGGLSSGGSAATLNITTLDVQTGGSLSADQLGFGTRSGGPGASPDNQGATHGGEGANNTDATYGSITNPITLGSSGENISGGGALILNVSNTTVNGTITANGGSFGDSGSGGSVNLTSSTLTGSGTVRANGGGSTMAGGGGRVAVILSSGTDFGSTTFQAYGGNGSTDGAAGTVYLEDASDGSGNGQLIIDNNSVVTAAGTDTLISSSVTDTAVGDVLIQNAGSLQMDASTTLTVSGNWTNSGTADLADGTVIFDATDTGNTITPGGDYFDNVTFNGVGGAWDLQGAADINDALTITNGTFDLNGQNIDLTGGTFSNNGTLRLRGSETLTAVTNDTDSGAIEYDGDGDAATDTFTITDKFTDYWSLTLNATDGATDTFTLGTNITIAGNFTNTAGTFDATTNTTTVTLDGTSQTVTGDTTFYNLTKDESADDTTDDSLTFGANNTFTVTNTLTLNGRDDNDRINVQSSSGGTTFILDVTSGIQNVDYLELTDSEASTYDIICLSCNNGGGNDDTQATPHWIFRAAGNLVIRGTVYSDEGVTALGDKTVTIAVNGTDFASTETNATTGAYSIDGVTATGGDVMTIYLEDEPENALLVTIAPGTDDDGLDLYQNRLITRQDNGGSLTNANLSTGTVSGEADITDVYTIASSNLTMKRDLTDDLVSHWKFEEGTGTSTIDSANSSNSGTLTDNDTGNGDGNVPPAWSITVPSTLATTHYSLDFDGVDDYIDITSPVISDTSTVTICTWINPNDNTFDNGEIINIDNGAGDRFRLYFDGSASSVLKFHKVVDTFSGVATSNGAPSTGTWAHLCGVAESSGTVTLYVNGVAQTSTGSLAGTVESSSNVHIGATLGLGSTAFYDGYLDDVRIYDRALAATEISQLANGVFSSYTELFTPTSHTFAPGGDIDVGDVDVNGTLTLSTNDATVSGTWDATGGAFTQDAANQTLFTGTGTESDTITSNGGTFGDVIINDGLVGYWKMDESANDSCAGGEDACDSSGYGRHGAGAGATGTNNTPQPYNTSTADVNFTNSYARDFDGTDDNINIDDVFTESMLTGGYTVGTWFYADSLPATGGILASQDSLSDSTPNFILQSNTDTIRLYMGGTYSSAVSVATGGWHHATVAYTGNATKVGRLYLDGAFQATVTGSVDNATSRGTDFTIGNGYNGYFDGRLDDVRVYDRELSTAEIALLGKGNQSETGVVTYTLEDALDVDGDLILNTGTFDTKSGEDNSIAVGGTWENNGGIFTANSGTVTLNATTTGHEVQSGGQLFNNLTISGAAGGWTLGDALAATDTISQSNGTVSTDSTNSWPIYAANYTRSAGTLTTNFSRLTLDSTTSKTLTLSSTLYDLDIGDRLKRGLVGYWKMDEGSDNTCAGGQDACDSSGEGNHGTFSGAAGANNLPQWTAISAPTYNNPYALDFDGTDDIISVADSAELQPTEAITISAWVRSGLDGTDYEGLVSKSALGSTSGDYDLIRDVNNKLSLRINNNAASVTSTGTILIANGWTHIAATYDRATMKLFIDGAQDATTTSETAAITASTKPLYIGEYFSSTNSWMGQMDDVRIYNRALTASEITELAGATYTPLHDGSTNTYSMSSNLDVNNDLTFNSGTISAGSFGINLAGDWNNYTGGTSHFTAGTSTVSFDGTDQAINGSNTFNIFSKIEGANDATDETLTFEAAETQIISDTWTLTGRDDDDRINLRSSINDTQWLVDPQGTRNLTYLDVADSNNINATAIIACDGDIIEPENNNTNWEINNGLTQNDWRWYVDTDNENVTDPWPSGSRDFAENTLMTILPSANDPMQKGDEVRARVNMTASCTIAATSTTYKLQYAASNDCTDSGNSWVDVGVGGGGSVWRYATSSVSDGAGLTVAKLASTDVLENYIKSASSGTNQNAVSIGQDMEWDFHIEHNGATDAATYCFRAVETDGTPLDVYNSDSYPKLETKPGTGDLLRHGNVFFNQVERGATWAD